MHSGLFAFYDILPGNGVGILTTPEPAWGGAGRCASNRIAVELAYSCNYHIHTQ